MAKKFNIHDWYAKVRLNEQFTPDLEDDDLKRSKIQQMMDKEKSGVIEYGLSDEEKAQLTDMTNEFVRKLTDVRGGNYSGDRLLAALQFVQLVIQDAEPMLYPDLDEVEVTGMEPDSGNMEKEYKVVGPKNVSEPLKDVTIEYNGQPYILNFEYGDVISDSNERGGKDVWYEATAEDGTYFMVDVYEDTEGVVEEVYWDTLEIEPSEGLEEQNTVAANTGFSMQPGNSMTYATKNAFGKRKKRK